MDPKDIIRELLFQYETAGLIEHDTDKVLSLLTEDIMGVGMGEQGFVASKQDIAEIMGATARQDPSIRYELDIRDVVIRMTSGQSAQACAQVNVKSIRQGRTAVSAFMQSLSFVRRGEDWRICALHASPVMLTEESIETYPMTFADNTLAQLRLEMQEKAFQLANQSLSGGVLGTFAAEHFPVSFANDALLHMLGYEREEFERAFSGGIDGLFPPGELERFHAAMGLDARIFSVHTQWLRKDGAAIWVELRSQKTVSEGGAELFLTVAVDVTELVELQLETERQNGMILSSMHYAGRIQKNLLPSGKVFRQAFSDYAILWDPKDIVGGDLYWLRNFKHGSILCVCDCTGHGIPGALLTMLAASALDAAVDEESSRDPAQVLQELDRRLANILNAEQNILDGLESKISLILDGCDIAVLSLAGDGSVTIASANIPVFICNGQETRRIRGQRLHVGEGSIKAKGDVRTVYIPPDPENRFFISTDGLFDQIGGCSGQPFGFRVFSDLILKHHGEPLEVTAQRIYNVFQEHMGSQPRRDDIEMIAFKP